MNKKQLILCVVTILVLLTTLSGCGKTDSKTGIGSQKSVSTAEKGDGTITVSLNISNPEQKQEKYSLIFGGASSFKVGEPIRNPKSYTVDTGTSLTVNIADIINYVETDEAGNFKVGVTAARLEDVNVRNPLSETMVLTFPDVLTCNQGRNITLNITDKPLTSLYPEGTLLVRIVDSENQGGYVNFLYESTDDMTLTFGRGSSGPDFLVAFNASEFKASGIRDAVLVITGEKNKYLSEQVELQFDENGYCKQGQYIEMEIKR